ncbi:putative aminoglycoside phosphotransferase [Kaistia sp. 32K]|uniref:phosphotransferase family protein n=1 Tax=Kaistia sp. 32K TaxID=2795690 RepID=UPI001915523F|nr:phosphotransferase [Kaistia sp. 32K]BCP51594.1 putative aminoglycoside phosphotransferase [Kaistia sp. 32K]
METIDRELAAWLVRAGLVEEGAPMVAEPLTGGVASDIWRIEAGGRRFAVKRALAKLRVARDWRAPVSRNGNEVEWLLTAGRIAPDAVPHILAHDAGIGAFAMDYLKPEDHPVWKAELRAGRADPAFAAAVGRTIAAIHAATAHSAECAARFDTDAIFHSIRLEPYLEATAEAHPDLAPALMALSRETLATKIALVHGDVSPKNILVRPKGPVFLDAECAWYGDPAFDLAFCLNHMLLKCLWVPASRAAYLACFDALAGAYLDAARWEPREKIEARAARLLPGLLLARVDGKSPAEYITSDEDKARVRRVARPLIATPPTTLAAIRDAWEEEISQ